MADEGNGKSGVGKYIVGAIGGAVAALIGAGVLFPPNDWTPTVTKTATDKARATLPAAAYKRTVIVHGEFRAKGSGEINLEIKANKSPCNTVDRTYKNPTTSDQLHAKDFCVYELPADTTLELEVGPVGGGTNTDAIQAELRLQTRRVGRSLF